MTVAAAIEAVKTETEKESIGTDINTIDWLAKRYELIYGKLKKQVETI
jgi:hypothetical protein